jgi:hypothetical protein
MLKPPQKRFAYKAHGVALAATFTKPRAEFLEAQAPVALPVTGGMSSAVVENFNFQNIISFRRTASHASGTQNPDTKAFNTLVTSETEGFNILGVVSADRIVVRVASKHFIDPPQGAAKIPEPSMVTLGSHIDNLRIAGHPIGLKLDLAPLCEWDTYSKVLEGCHKRGTGYKVAGGTIITSIFSEIDTDLPHVGNRIDFPEFGSLYLGELIIDADERRLTMIRFELGCSYSGSGGAGGADTNGSPIPP